ncbi:MAG TPA: hypothetical protein VHS03_15275 [Gaiellaceae bacterium]|jgi:hypothetical protein|nr:hypothetical protein [Gaiellaceae bacterium]
MVRFKRRLSPGRLAWSVGAAVLAIVAVLLALANVAGAGKHRVAVVDQFLKAISAPLKLRAPGDPAEIRYDISCLPPDGNAEGPGVCDGGGTVYFRASGNVTASVPLQLDPNAQVGRYVAPVPAAIWAAPWFTYYATVTDNSTGRSIMVPPGGAGAPQISFAIGSGTIDLGAHVFGVARQPSARVASATWGSGDGEVGLEDGADQPTGAASFDVDSSGNVYLLDEANDRMLKFGAADSPQAIPLPGLAGVKSDLRVSDASSTAYLLEVANASSARPVLRSYTLQGGPLSASTVADAAAAQIRLSGSTAYVSEYPSSVWAPVLQANGTVAVDSTTQFARAIPGGPSQAGNLVMLAGGNDVRIGTYVPIGSTYRLSSFRITSTTPVADVQLAQTLPSGRVLVVFSVYSDTDHEYEAVVVDPSGALVDQFSLAAFDWAQSMPLSRFRLVGSSLYELGTTDQGAFVDRYDLEVS